MMFHKEDITEIELWNSMFEGYGYSSVDGGYPFCDAHSTSSHIVIYKDKPDWMLAIDQKLISVDRFEEMAKKYPFLAKYRLLLI